MEAPIEALVRAGVVASSDRVSRTNWPNIAVWLNELRNDRTLSLPKWLST